jgi:hypothetical protein
MHDGGASGEIDLPAHAKPFAHPDADTHAGQDHAQFQSDALPLKQTPDGIVETDTEFQNDQANHANHRRKLHEKEKQSSHPVATL